MLEISLLGKRVIRNAAGVIRTRSSRTLALVAYLVTHPGTPQTRQRIAAAFWPDSTDEQALTNLRRELHHLRQALGGDQSLVVTSKDLSWRDTDSCRVDVRVFVIERAAALAAADVSNSGAALAHAREAVEQYGGELIPGSYDDWLLEERSELEQYCIDLLDLVGDLATQLGELPMAAEAARRRIQYRPIEETGYRRLMEVQGDLGDRAGAVRTYHRCASVLERELGIEPDPATRKILDRLLSRVGPLPAPRSPLEPTAARSGPAAARLIGRAEELELVQDVWRAAAGGHPSLVLVNGDAGVGKSRLVMEVAELARLSGAIVPSAQCFGTSAGQLALSPVADWLRHPTIQIAVRTLDPVWRMEVERLLPPVTGRAERRAAPRAMVDVWQRHRFFEGLARALFSVDRPIMLMLENMQWCDQETLAFLTFCLGLAGDAPLMVAATVRNDEQQPGLVAWTARMRATGMLTEVSLNPLDEADTIQLAEAISSQRFAADQGNLLQAATGGFPLYIVEAARSGAAQNGGADSAWDLRDVLRTRLGQVTASAREVAGLAAAVGRDFSLDLLTEASDLDADAVVQAIDELWRHRILREVGDGYDFSHDLLRESAYVQVSSAKRWLLHRRIAQGLELVHADDPDAISAQLAEQYARGGRGERAVTYYRRAADVAAQRYAHGEAIRLLKEALSIVLTLSAGRERDGKELTLLEAIAAPLNAHYGFAAPQLREILERSVALAEVLGRRDSLLLALVGLGSSQFVHGYVSQAHRTAVRALSLVEPGSEFSGGAHFVVGITAVSLGRPAEGLRHLELAAEQGGTRPLSIGTRADVHARAFAAHAHWLMGHERDALASCDEAIRLARATNTPYNVAISLAYGAVTHQLDRNVSVTREMVGELRELCERYDFAYYREWALIVDGWTRGDSSGFELARRGVDNLVAQESFARLPYWLSVLAELAERAGRPEIARAKLDAAISAAIAREDMWWLPEVMRLRAAFDKDEAVLARLQSAAKLAATQGSVALYDRCANDLAGYGVRSSTVGVRTPS